MKQYISESEAIYMDAYQGLFSKKLAEWAIGKMVMKDPATKEKKHVKEVSIEDFKTILTDNGKDIQDEFLYSAWYLYHMAMADYPKTCKTDAERVSFIEETICDPDGSPENVLSCFVAKMGNAGVPIYWELYM